MRYQIDGKKLERKVEGADNTLNIIFNLSLSAKRAFVAATLSSFMVSLFYAHFTWELK